MLSETITIHIYKKGNGQNTTNCLIEYKSLYSIDLFKYLLKFYQIFIKNDISPVIYAEGKKT